MLLGLYRHCMGAADGRRSSCCSARCVSVARRKGDCLTRPRYGKARACGHLVLGKIAVLSWIAQMAFRFTTRRLLILATLAAIVAAAWGAVLRWVHDAHPQAITRFLAGIEQEYRDGTNWGGKQHAKDMIEYVKTHYPYESMSSHRGTPVANELATQRERTIEAIEGWLKRQQ